ncbi:MAG: hypothetical protein HOH38_04935 [Nitrospinaceae bacterium]|nr:hypothetical protein [Nitrospinaceae bacterium]
MNFKMALWLCGLAVVLYFIWPFIVWAIKSYIFQLVIEYGLYALLLMAGGGYYFWRRLKA